MQYFYLLVWITCNLACWSFDRKTYTWSSRKSSHSWNLADFTMKSGGFHHEIWQISWNPWNPADFTREIWRISWNPWNLVDFTREIRRISPRYHLSNPSKIIKASVSAKTLQFWWMQGGGYDQGFHEIHPEIWWISLMKSGGFHPDFTCEIHPKL